MRDRNQHADYSVRLSALHRRRKPGRRRRVSRRLPFRSLRLRSRLTAFVLVSLAVASVLVFAGVTGSLNQSTTAEVQTSTPSTAPFTSNEPQAVNSTQVTTTPNGLVANSAQSTNMSGGNQPNGTLGSSETWESTTIDSCEIQLVRTITGFNYAAGVAADASDNIRVIEQNAAVTGVGKLKKFDPNGVLLSSIGSLTAPSAVDTPRGIAINAAGDTVVIEDGGGFTIVTRDGATGSVDSSFNDFTQNSSSLDVDASGNYVIAQIGRIGVYTPSGALASTFGTGLLGTTMLGVAIASSTGHIYVNDSVNTPARVLRFNSDGTFDSVFATGISQPEGLAVDADGNVYVGELSGPVHIFASNGSEITTIGTGILSGTPHDIAIDSQGRIIVADGSGGVKIFSALPTCSDVGNYSSIAVVDEDTIYISYLDESNSDVKFAKSSDGGDSWTTLLVGGIGFTVDGLTGIAAPNANNVFIAYYDDTNDDLRFARSTDGGDNWTLSVVDSAGSVGEYASISAPTATNVFISYFDYTNMNLKVARSTNGGVSWTLAVADSDGLVGQGTSIVALTASDVFVSYQDFSGGGLKFARSTDGGVNWETEIVEPASTYAVADHTSLAIPDANTMYIAYDAVPSEFEDEGDGPIIPEPTARVGPENSLRVARSTDGGDNWTITEVEATADDLPRGMIAAADATRAFISFRDTGESLRFARTVDGTDWADYTIEGDGFDGVRSAIGVVDANTLYISYYDEADLKFAESETGGLGSNWFSGTLNVDTDGDDSTNLVSFTAVDVDGDDEVDLLEISSDDSTFGEGTLDDSATGSDDDERIGAGSGSSTSQNVVLGEYTFLVSFDHQQSEAGVGVSVQSVSWFTGQFTIDADADGVADNAVAFALSDSDSNGIYDRLDLSSDDVILGEEQVEPPTPSLTNAQTGVDDDERITGSSSIRLGANYTFTVAFESNPSTSAQDASITSKTWYTGTFEADANDDGSDEPLDFVVLDSDSNGLYDTLELDADDSGIYGSDESVESASDTLTVGNIEVSFEFENNPADDATVSLVDESETSPDASSFLGFNDPVDSQQQVLELPAVDSGESGSALTASELGALLGELLGQVVEINLDSGAEITDEAFGDLLETLSEQNEEFQEQVAAIDVPPETISPVPSRIGLDISGQWFVWDEVVITLDFSVEDPELRIAQIAALTGGEVAGSSPGGRIYQIRYALENRDDLGDLRGLTDRFPCVTSASRHYLIVPEGPFSKVPDDSVFSEWDLGNPDGNNWNLEFMKAPAAWDITTGSDKVFVGVIDGAMDSGHSDLSGNVASTFGPFSAIANGHGTHVSGIICADGNNGQGITGVAWDCSLRMFDFGARSPVLATDAMIRAVDQGASIINISLQWVDNSQCGTQGTSPTLKKVQETNAIFGRAIEYARKQNKDVLWVIAAGNECRDTKYASPASLVEKYPQDVVVVGSIDQDGGLSSFSNYGDLVDVAAPGGGILSTLPRTCAANEAGDLVCKDEYGVKSGTSMAAPHVSGLAVLIRSAHPEFNARRVKACIVNFATRPIQSHDFNIVDAEKSVQCGVTDEVTAPNIPTPPPSNNGGGGQRRPFGGR